MKKVKVFSVALLTCAHLLMVGGAQAQQSGATVEFNPLVQRYVGDVSALDREKFIKLHSGYTSTDSDILSFLNKYDATLGRGFWGAFSWSYQRTKKVGVYPAYKDEQYNNTSVLSTNGIVTAERPESTIISWGIDLEKAGAWAAEYFNNWSDRPIASYYEPISEPFVQASEYKKFGAPSKQELIDLMSDFFASVGKHIRATPQLANLKVVGYGAAYPTYEQNDFSQWNSTMKNFIDRAGQYMDGISIHLYDGLNAESGQHTYRSGSNSEALMDLIENYCYIKLGVVKPFAMTEYGGIFNPTEGDVYDEEGQSRLVGSINHLMLGFMEREDNMLLAIPFITGKATNRFTEAFNYEAYGPTLFLPEDPYDMKGTAWYYNTKIHFYELWKDVTGDRFDIQCDNPDIQTLALRDGDKIYLVLDNLDEAVQKVSLNLSEMAQDCSFSSVKMRRLHSTSDGRGIIYGESNLTEMPSEISLEHDETVLLIANVSSSVYGSQMVNAVRRTKYYEKEYLRKIYASKAMESRFAGVKVGQGRASLRMSISRDFDLSKCPTIEVNGNSVTVPDNWAGYDQLDRPTEQFYGMIKIPVPMDYLKNGENLVRTTFPDAGGRLATMILEVETYDEHLSFVQRELGNGDFESGDMSSWIPLSRGGKVAVSEESGVGSYAAEISGLAAIGQSLVLEGSASYRFEALVSASPAASVVVMVNGEAIANIDGGNGNYDTIEGEFKTSTSGEVVITIESAVNGEQVLVDECSISKIAK